MLRRASQACPAWSEMLRAPKNPRMLMNRASLRQEMGDMFAGPTGVASGLDQKGQQDLEVM